MLVTTFGNDEPLCPMSNGFDVSPQAQLHAFKNKLLDEFYGKFEKDDDGEFLNEESGKAYYEVAYESRFNDRMKLFTATSTPLKEPTSYVEAFWYQCLVCGFVLSAVGGSR